MTIVLFTRADGNVTPIAVDLQSKIADLKAMLKENVKVVQKFYSHS